MIPPSGGARDQRRQIFITDVSQNAVVTLWGDLADAFDDDRLLQWSKHEPIVAIFVAVFVDLYSVMLAFKSTLATQWHINVEAPEVSAIFESTKSIPYEIEMQQAVQGRCQPTEATITELADLEPTDVMVKMTGGIWDARNVGES